MWHVNATADLCQLDRLSKWTSTGADRRCSNESISDRLLDAKLVDPFATDPSDRPERVQPGPIGGRSDSDLADLRRHGRCESIPTMKTKKLAIAFALVAAFTTAACSKKEDKVAGGGGAKATEGAAKVEVSPAMTAFLSDLKGKSKDVEAAIKTHGVEGLDHKDMTMYDLTSPKVTAATKDGGKECYTFDAKAGMTTRTYDVCWKDGKISEVADKGMR